MLHRNGCCAGTYEFQGVYSPVTQQSPRLSRRLMDFKTYCDGSRFLLQLQHYLYSLQNAEDADRTDANSFDT